MKLTLLDRSWAAGASWKAAGLPAAPAAGGAHAERTSGPRTRGSTFKTHEKWMIERGVVSGYGAPVAQNPAYSPPQPGGGEPPRRSVVGALARLARARAVRYVATGPTGGMQKSGGTSAIRYLPLTETALNLKILRRMWRLLYRGRSLLEGILEGIWGAASARRPELMAARTFTESESDGHDGTSRPLACASAKRRLGSRDAARAD